MPRLARYLGRWIYHSGWYPDRKVRLYDRRKARWVGDFVHESVRSQGRTGILESDILHFTCDSLSEHLKTLDHYTTLAAQELAAGKVPVPMWSLIFDPPWNFVKAYIFQRGFLDGLEGLIISYMAAFYTFLKYSKARNMSGCAFFISMPEERCAAASGRYCASSRVWPPPASSPPCWRGRTRRSTPPPANRAGASNGSASPAP